MDLKETYVYLNSKSLTMYNKCCTYILISIVGLFVSSAHSFETSDYTPNKVTNLLDFPPTVVYPKFFTPNNDNANDLWNIEAGSVNPNIDGNAKITIFDRYGKILATITPNSKGWDGVLGSYSLPADDYWFMVELTDGSTFKGHFSLLR